MRVEQKGGTSCLLLEQRGDVHRAVEALRKAGEKIVVFFHLSNPSEVGRVRISDDREVDRMEDDVFPEGSNRKIDICARAGECLT